MDKYPVALPFEIAAQVEAIAEYRDMKKSAVIRELVQLGLAASTAKKEDIKSPQIDPNFANGVEAAFVGLAREILEVKYLLNAGLSRLEQSFFEGEYLNLKHKYLKSDDNSKCEEYPESSLTSKRWLYQHQDGNFYEKPSSKNAACWERRASFICGSVEYIRTTQTLDQYILTKADERRKAAAAQAEAEAAKMAAHFHITEPTK